MSHNVIAIDFDNTIWDDGIINKGKNITNNFYKDIENFIVIYTARQWKDFFIVKEILDTNHVLYHSIVCGKMRADVYVDDKAMEFKK